jgi:hypothetical protein
MMQWEQRSGHRGTCREAVLYRPLLQRHRVHILQYGTPTGRLLAHGLSQIPSSLANYLPQPACHTNAAAPYRKCRTADAVPHLKDIVIVSAALQQLHGRIQQQTAVEQKRVGLQAGSGVSAALGRPARGGTAASDRTVRTVLLSRVAF